MRKLMNRFWLDEEGAALIEYGLLVGLIAVVCAVGVTALGGNLNTMFTNIGNYLSGLGIPA